MTEDFDKCFKNSKKLLVSPMKIPRKIKEVPISRIKSGKISEKSIQISNAIVAYLDILGFSQKKDVEDIETSLMDFSGPLVVSAINYPKVRFNVFSDCAFVSAHIKNSEELLSAVRFAFTQWTADGVLVRGGIALGTYRETYTVALDMASKNFIGNLFSGSAVTTAVKLEGSGHAALLFTNKECAKFLAKKHREPIFALKDQRIIGWSNQDSVLYWFIGISFLRLLKLLSLRDGEKDLKAEILLNNIRYAINATESLLPRFLVFAILSLPSVNPEARKKALNLLKIKDPDDFVPFNKFINRWLKHKDKIEFLKTLADFDSSIP